MSSQHPRQHTLPDGLFRGLSSFQELEARIARLPEPLERGDALEIFVEAYLWRTNIWQVQDLWLVGQVPLEVRQTLNLPADSKGIDGVFRTRTGTLVPYQVKHRIGRPKVGVAEVATFLGLTERATRRVLISNATRYATDVENRDHLEFITGTQFDALTATELQGIANWLDPGGYSEGSIMLRGSGASSGPEPSLTVVPLDKLDARLPPETIRISPAERQEALRARRRSVQMRRRW